MITPARFVSMLQPVIVLLAGMFVLLFIWGLVSNDDYEDDEFSVTITYDCEKVLHERNYPSDVLQQCLELRDEIQRRNHH